MKRRNFRVIWMMAVVTAAALSASAANEPQSPTRESAASDMPVFRATAAGALTDGKRVDIAPFMHATAAEQYNMAMKILANGDQGMAENLLNVAVTKYPTDQRLLFFKAVCIRSRFEVRQAFALFSKVVQLDASTPAGRCSQLVLNLDLRKNGDRDFADLQSLAKENPDDPLIIWMAAVQCRALDRDHHGPIYDHRNRIGAAYFRHLLELMAPGMGPVLVHQTYGNLLEDLGDYVEALPHRELAVKLQPAGWSYQGLGNTLTGLGEYDKANDAFQKASHEAEDNGEIWFSWANNLECQKNYESALEKWQHALQCLPGDSRVLNRLGWCFLQLHRYSDAVSAFQHGLAAEPNDPDGIVECNLGKAYYDWQHFSEALAPLDSAAKKGNAGAMCTLGVMYLQGEGVAKNPLKAIKLLREAADKGNTNAMYDMGNLCRLGWGGFDKDPVAAIAWYRKAAEAGHVEAMYNLAHAYATGEGMKQRDPEQAIRWFRKAADGGDADAEHWLSLFYARGDGVPRDPAKAAALEEKAKAMGYVNH